MTNLTLKNKRIKKKLPEIERFQKLIKSLGIKTVDIARETDSSERTINNFIWQNMPLGAHLLRDLHSKYNVSLDWLLSGKGEMLLVDQDGKTSEPGADYVVNQVDDRTQRLCDFIHQFMDSASADEKIWLEMQIRLHVPHYQRFLDERGE